MGLARRLGRLIAQLHCRYPVVNDAVAQQRFARRQHAIAR